MSDQPRLSESQVEILVHLNKKTAESMDVVAGLIVAAKDLQEAHIALRVLMTYLQKDRHWKDYLGIAMIAKKYGLDENG